MKPRTLTASRDLRLHLQHELERRCQENPNYSLRAFARSLGVDSSSLSKIVNNKRSITPHMFNKLAEGLGLGPAERAHYTRQLPLLAPERGHLQSSERIDLSTDQFETVSKWHHFAILELTNLRTFTSDPKYIGKMLGLTVSEVNFALERMERLGMIRRDANGEFKKTGNYSTLKLGDSSLALRRLQRSILDQAKKAITEVPPHLRDNSTMTVAIDSSKLETAKAMIKNFRRQLSDYLNADSYGDAVYQLSFHIFPVSKLPADASPASEGNNP